MLYNCTKIGWASHHFLVYNMQLPSAVVNLLSPALKDKPIKAFGLGNNEFGSVRAGIKFAIEIIQSNQQLKAFAWADNPIESLDDANHLVEAVIIHPTVDLIRLENCFGEDICAYSILCSILASNKEFSHIDLETNNIRTGGGTEIPDFLAKNPPLNSLYLEQPPG